MPKKVADKKDWLILGHQLFSEHGISGIIIEKMARKLKCNKSSFYWHFKSKKEFILKMVDFWVESETHYVIDEVEKVKAPTKKYKRFIELVFQHDPYLDFIFHLKRYAKDHKEIQQIIEEVDSKRLKFTAKVFRNFGYSQKEAKLAASILYKYLIGYHEMYRYQAPNPNYLKAVNAELKFILGEQHKLN